MSSWKRSSYLLQISDTLRLPVITPAGYNTTQHSTAWDSTHSGPASSALPCTGSSSSLMTSLGPLLSYSSVFLQSTLQLLWICRGSLSHTNSPWSSRVLHILLFIDNVLDLEVSLLIFIIPQSFLSMLEVRNVYNTGFQRFKLYSLFSIWRLSRQSQGFPHNIYSEKNEETRVSIPYYPFIIKYYTLKLCKYSTSIIED